MCIAAALVLPSWGKLEFQMSDNVRICGLAIVHAPRRPAAGQP